MAECLIQTLVHMQTSVKSRLFGVMSSLSLDALAVSMDIRLLLFSNVERSWKGLLRKSLSLTIYVKDTEQYFPVVLFIMLYKVVLSLWTNS